MEEAHAPVTVLAGLRKYGLRLMLDDFGTGYSSLAYLKRFPLDVLKIDRSFIAGLGHDEDDAAIVAAVIEMARQLGLIVVAEGVERPEQLERLRELGCDRVQGRLIAGPMPAAGVERLMASASHRRLSARLRRPQRRPLAPGAAPGRTAPAGFLAGDGAGQLDLPRASRGGLAGGCFAVFTCRPPEDAYATGAYFAPADPARARAEALAQVALLLRLERASGGRLRVVRSSAELDGPGLARGAPSRGRRADRPGARGARGAGRCGPALARSGLEPAQRLRHRRAVRVSRVAGPGPGPDRGRARAGRGVRRAGRARRRLASQRARLLGRGRAGRRAARRVAQQRPRPVPVAAQPDRRPAAGDRRARRARRDQLPRRLPARGRRGGRRHAALPHRRPRRPCGRARRGRRRRARLGLRRRDHARRARRRVGAARALARAARRGLRRGRARQARPRQLASCAEDAHGRDDRSRGARRRPRRARPHPEPDGRRAARARPGWRRARRRWGWVPS